MGLSNKNQSWKSWLVHMFKRKGNRSVDVIGIYISYGETSFGHCSFFMG